MINRKGDKSGLRLIFLGKEALNTNPKKDTLDILSFKGKYKQFGYLPESQELYVGLDFESKIKSTDYFNGVDWYEIGAGVINKTRDYKPETFYIDQFFGSSRELSLFLLGMLQASWHLDKYLDNESAKALTISVNLSSSVSDIFSPEDEQFITALHKGMVLARSIIDDVPEVINPETVKSIIQKELEDYSQVEIKSLSYNDLNTLGMEGITFVGRASRYKPFLSHVIIKPKQKTHRKVCLVGKGLTYDTGGYSLKPSNYMETMKTDMAGSATMFGVIKTLAELNNLDHTEVHWISAFAENMVDGSGYKPDDILTTYAGLTVEVLNTDAEGRLTLADALAYATLQNPDLIIDAATLTGAAVLAVTEYYTALMGNDDELITSLISAFLSEKEKTTYTPMPEILRESLKGSISDLKNITESKLGGHLSAGLFLSYFVDQNTFRNKEKLGITSPKAFPWVHLDIAGSASNNKKNSLTVQGATGQSIRTLTRWIVENDKTL